VRFLLRERLLDELQLLVHPVIVGSGARLFKGYGESLPLTLAHCHAHGNGVVARRRAWGAVRADFEPGLADTADPAIAAAEIASELRRAPATSG
jgi:dihydrofolate reductase